MKKFRKLLILVFLIILSSCTNNIPQDVTDLIVKPKSEEPQLKGTWQVEEIQNASSSSSSEGININDKLYIDEDLVAFNDEYALPPKFTSKYVELSNYLESRGIDLKVSDKENVIVLNASQGQLFSKDFVCLSDKKIFFVLENNLIFLKKISDSVDSKIHEKYFAKANKERTTTESGEQVEEDITILLGVRERIDLATDLPNYYYYTYCIRIEPDNMARIEKAENIYFPKKDEFWRFTAKINPESGKYDNFLAYPVRLDKEIDSEKNQKKYGFNNTNISMRFNYVNENYISFDYSLEAEDLPISKYGTINVDQIKDNSLMTINEFTGESGSNQVFENFVYDEVVKNFGTTKEEDVDYDFTNFGIVRNQGLWVLQTSYQIKNEKGLQQKSFPLNIAARDDLLNREDSYVTIDQIRNINNQEKDFFELANKQFVIIQNTDEISFYRINKGLIDVTPSFSIPLSNPTTVIMLEQGLGNYADKWEKSFKENNDIIR